jgi:hypothetical protein
LQKQILVAAWRRRQSGKPVEVYPGRVITMREVDGHERHVDLYNTEFVRECLGRPEDQRAHRSIQAALSRAKSRLIKRGLAKRDGDWWGVGLRLTDAGVEMAKRLSANLVHSSPGVHR